MVHDLELQTLYSGMQYRVTCASSTHSVAQSASAVLLSKVASILELGSAVQATVDPEPMFMGKDLIMGCCSFSPTLSIR